MKPIILPITVNDQGKVSMTLKELEDLLDKTYNAGRSDGGEIHYDCPYRYWQYPTVSDPIISDPTKPYVTWTCTGTDPACADNTTTISGDSTSTTTSNL